MSSHSSIRATPTAFFFYVMPFVDGETLRDRIDREKQLPVEDAVSIASAVASALDYAHRNNVIHRDIKPANILIHDGQPVVADFGIALAVSNAGGGRLTETGLSLGTPHYMSPEQASADRDLTPQSDIFALACVTYEMLTGSPPFSGPTAQAVLMQILTEDPKAVTTLRRTVPLHVEAAIAKALEKLPADRFSSADAFARALGDPGATEARRAMRSRGGPGVTVAPAWWRLAWPALAILMAGLAAWSWMTRPEEARGPVLRLGLFDDEFAISATPGSGALALSPGGSQVAFIHSGTDGRPAVSVRRLDSFRTRQVATSEAITAVAFSPDGRWLAYHDGESIRTISLDAGEATSQAIAPSIDRNNERAVRWESDGYVYFQDTELNLARVPAGGGSPEILSRREEDGVILSPPVLLAGQDAGLVEISGGRYGGTVSFGVFDLATGSLDTLGVGTAPRLVDEFIIWLDAGTLYGQRFDSSGRRGVGPVRALLDGIPSRTRAALFDVSSNGTLVHQVASSVDDNLVAVSRTGLRVDRGQSAASNLGFRLSPQGDRLVFEVESGDRSDIWVLDLASGTRSRITFEQVAFYPTWNPDGSKVAYYKVSDGVYDLYWRNADGSGVEEVLLANPAREIEVAFLPDGERIVVRQGDRARADGSDIYLYDIGDPDSGRPITDGQGNAVSPMLSPDARYVAYTSDALGTTHVFVRSLENPAERHQVSDEAGSEPYWHPDGTELFFRTPTHLVSAPISLEGGFRLTGRPVELFVAGDLQANSNHTSYALMPDGETFLFNKEPRIAQTRIVINWLEEIRERMAR